MVSTIVDKNNELKTDNMNENVNLVEILSDAPAGTSLYSPLFGTVVLKEVDTSPCYQTSFLYPIKVEAINKNGIRIQQAFTKEGFYYDDYSDSKCMLFPSEEQRDWSEFRVSKKECECCRKFGCSRCPKCDMGCYEMKIGDTVRIIDFSWIHRVEDINNPKTEIFAGKYESPKTDLGFNSNLVVISEPYRIMTHNIGHPDKCILFVIVFGKIHPAEKQSHFYSVVADNIYRI